MAEMDSITAASPPKKKRLPFKRTISRRKSPDPFGDDSPGKANPGSRRDYDDDDDDDGISMFSRSKDLFPLAIEEQQRELEKEEESRKAGTAQRENSEKHGSTKRRRISGDRLDSSDDEGFSVSGGRRRAERNSTPRSTAEYVKAKSPSPIPGFMDIVDKPKIARLGSSQSPRTSKMRKESHIPIDISEDDDIDIPVSPGDVPRSAGSDIIGGVLVVDDDSFVADGRALDKPDSEAGSEDGGPIAVDDEPPDEFSKYVQEARERQARATSGQAEASEAIDRNGDVASRLKSATPAPVNLSIKVMVTSELPGTASMLAKLKLSQPIAVVRDAWLRHQQYKASPLPEDTQKQIFLTWKGNRIYNTSTCASLNLDVDPAGKVRWDPYADDESGYYSNGGLHFQAWTEDLYTQHVREKERERRRALGELDDEDDDLLQAVNSQGVGSQQAGEEAEPAEKPIRVILKAKDYEALNTKVHLHTTVETMLTVFREHRGVPDGKDAAIYFDGERLDENSTVGEAEIEDMDNLEVHIK